MVRTCCHWPETCTAGACRRILSRSAHTNPTTSSFAPTHHCCRIWSTSSAIRHTTGAETGIKKRWLHSKTKTPICRITFYLCFSSFVLCLIFSPPQFSHQFVHFRLRWVGLRFPESWIFQSFGKIFLFHEIIFVVVRIFVLFTVVQFLHQRSWRIAQMKRHW